MKGPFLFILLTGLLSAFGSARANLQQQYANQKDCVSYFESNHLSRYYCVDGNNNVFYYNPNSKRKEDLQGKIGEETYVPAWYPYRGAFARQFEIENGKLINYVCGVNSNGLCNEELKRYVYPRVR